MLSLLYQIESTFPFVASTVLGYSEAMEGEFLQFYGQVAPVAIRIRNDLVEAEPIRLERLLAASSEIALEYDSPN